MHRLHRILVTTLLLWVAIAGLFLAFRDSLTTDEDVHMASGYTILTRHDFRFDPEHPPLFKAISAVPLLFIRLNPPKDDQALWNAAQPTFYDSWHEARQWGDEWTYVSGNPADTMKVLARLPSVATLVGLCWLLYYAAREWFSPKVGLWTLFFAAFNPTLLAHGHLANDDVAVATAIVGSIILFWHYLRAPSAKAALWVGLATAATIGIKYTGFGLLPIFGLYLLFWGVIQRKGRRALVDGLIILLTVWLGIWILYGFQSPLVASPVDIVHAEHAWHIPYHLTVQKVLNISKVARFILPLAFIKGFIIVASAADQGRGTYLFGHFYWPSLWYYFPVIFILKTQLIALVLLLVGGLLALRSKAAAFTRTGYQILSLSFATFLALSMYSKLDIGIRHVAPVIALLMPFLGLIMVRLEAFPWRKYFSGLVIIMYALPVLIQLPYIIGFSNWLVQPYEGAWRYFNDSNLDWGQQAQEAAQLVKEQFGNAGVAVKYPWNPYQLEYYGMKTITLSPEVPPTDTLIMVTANQMSQAEFKRYRQLIPVATIANNTFFFRIPSQ